MAWGSYVLCLTTYEIDSINVFSMNQSITNYTLFFKSVHILLLYNLEVYQMLNHWGLLLSENKPHCHLLVYDLPEGEPQQWGTDTSQRGNWVHNLCETVLYNCAGTNRVTQIEFSHELAFDNKCAFWSEFSCIPVIYNIQCFYRHIVYWQDW